ncbi:MAG: discoidin domain-containing protein, partial [Aurantibacter sp.]
SETYKNPFQVDSPTTVKAIAVDPETGDQTQAISKYFDIAKKSWRVVQTSSGDMEGVEKMIDEDPKTFWSTDESVKMPQAVVIDLGDIYKLTGFTYWPNQERYPFGIITNYEFSVSNNGKNWGTVARGEFSNIVNSRLEQTVNFEKTAARYIKLRGVKVEGEDFRTSFPEIGVLTEK